MKNIYVILICLLGYFYAEAQCPAGQTEITIEVVAVGFPAEIGWELIDQTTGTVIACQPSGTYAAAGSVIEGPFCVIDGNTIVLVGYDTFGDDWNGGYVNVTITEDGSVNGCAAQDGCVVITNGGENVDVEPDVPATPSCDAAATNEEFVVTLPVFACDATPIMGCTDPAAPNFNTCASIDDGSCTPPPPANDMCANPVTVPVNPDQMCGMVVNGTIESATDSGLDTPPEDNVTCGGTEDDDVWFSFVATSTDHQIDLTNITGSTTDLYHSVWEGSCGMLTNIICSDPNTSTLSGLTPGTTYYVRVYSWTATTGQDSVFDICIGTPCSDPTVTATAVCQIGDESGFYVEVDVTDVGAGNTTFTIDVGGPQTDITAAGTYTYGPFPSGTPVDVVITGVDDAACGITITGLDMDCVCDPLSAEAIADGVVCPGDPFTLDATLNDVLPETFIDYTVTPAAAGSCTAVPDNPADCVDLALGDDAGSGPIPLGFSFDFFGLPYTDVCVSSNGYVTFTCVDETDLSEDPIPTPGDPDGIIALFWDDLNPTDAASLGPICTYPATIGGQTCFVVDYQGTSHFGGGETVTGQIIICPDGSITINCIDCQSDGGTDSAGQGIEDETGSTGYFDPAFPGGTVPGAATTSNCVTFTPNYDPPMPCDFVAWVTDINDIAGTTVSTTLTSTVNPTTTTTYYAIVDCNGVPCFDDVAVTMDDPANCTVCQGIDLGAGLPVIPTEVCSGATADICLTLIDAAEGLVVTGTIDGAPVTLTGVAGAGPNELCVTIDAPANETCAPVDVVIQIDAIQCTDGTDYPGILGGATLLDDLTGAGLNPINVPVYPTLTVNATGDGTCGDLVAELVAADGTVCASAAGSPFSCTADGETLDYDFTADVAAFIAVPADCPLPTLTGTLACGNCAAPCDGLAADPGIVSPIELCDGDGPIDVCFEMVDATQGINFDVNIDGAPAGVIAGVAGANPNELCIQLPMVANQTCDLISFNITFNAITCDNGDAIAGPASPSLADDLNAGGGIVINVYPNLTVNTAGDGTCSMLTATLDAADGTVCATAAGSPFTCMADGDVLSYDFSGDVTFTPPAGCPLSTLSGTLTCGNCGGGASCTLMAPACNACPDPTCESSTTIDLMTGMELNDANEFSGAVPAVIPNYDITTNMGTLTLPMGGDQIFAVSGVTGLTLPNNITEVCLTMDINVISGEIPFLLEFRIENGVPGQQLQFNAMVDGLGMCSVGGNLADAVPAAGFTFMNGASYAVVAAIADFDGTPVSEDLVVEISNIMLTVCAPDPAISGCTDPAFDNYDPDALCDDGSCSNDPTCPMCGACESPNELPFAEIGGGDPDFSFNGADAFDDGNAMGIFAGGNNTFAGHGWFIDQSAIPAGAVIEDYCIFADFNVIADPADLPIVIEFRIENNGVGTFIEFNTTVTTPGPITIGGNLSTGTEFPPFDINGTAPTLVVAIAVPGLGGTPPPTSDIIVEYSNVYITDGTCNPNPPPTEPTAPMVTDSACPDGMNLESGSIDYSATTCANADDVLEYSLDGGMTWSTAQPTYADVEAAAMGNTLDIRCECGGTASASVQVSIMPQACPGVCTLILGTEMVVCDANTAGMDTYTVTIPFDNGAEGTPGGGGYTVTTAGTLGGDNPMVTQMGSITITFTEGTPYDYQITGIAGNANETCDIMINGMSPTCDPTSDCTLILDTEMVVCDANTAGTDTYTVTIPFDNGVEGTPGGGGYTVTTSGTLGGDNPMVTQMGSITITFTEGIPYDYQITGIAGTGANETCDIVISGMSPTCDPCEDSITGTVSTDEPTCDLAGTMVEILDSNGMPVAGSPVTIDAMGNYSLPGPFICGTYTGQIVSGSAPQCYYDLSGSEGPFEFEVDGDGEADGVNFSTEPQVPTLSQWGLITLALLMMCFGAINMAYRKEKALFYLK